MEPNARLTAVVITHNRADEAAHTVGRMQALPEVARVIVIDNASSDGTCDRLRARYPDVLVVGLADNVGAAARNIGVRLARTPYVALCDDDTWWEPGYLGRVLAVMEAWPQVAVLTARVLVEPGGRVDPACLRMARSPLPAEGLPGQAVLGFLAGAAVVRRSAFLQAGGFDPRFFLGREEGLLAFDLAARGWRMLYMHDVMVHHRPSPNRDAGQRRYLLLRNSIYLAWLRLPFAAAVRETLHALHAAAWEHKLGELVRSLATAFRWLAAERAVLPPAVERARQLLGEHEPLRPSKTRPPPHVAPLRSLPGSGSRRQPRADNRDALPRGNLRN